MNADLLAVLCGSTLLAACVPIAFMISAAINGRSLSTHYRFHFGTDEDRIRILRDEEKLR